MATSKLKTKQSKQRKVSFTLDGREREIYISKHVDEATFMEFRQLVKMLVRWKRHGTPLCHRDQIRVNNLPLALRDALADKGLIEARHVKSLAGFLNGYLEERTDLKPRTCMAWKTSIKMYVDYFDDVPLHEVTQEKAALFRVHLVKQEYSTAYISKLIKNARHFFAVGKRRKLIDENPFKYVEAGSQINKARMKFVALEVTNRLIDACSNARDRLKIALARFAGLRIPSELVGLRWSEVDWDKGVFVVHSPKTERKGKSQRIVPIFDLDKPCLKLRPYLLAARQEAPEGEDRIFPEIHEKKSLGSWAEKLWKRAGVAMWEKPFQNMRSSCATDLRDKFPAHLCEAWLGHTGKVADDHYRQVTEDHIAQATGKFISAETISTDRTVYWHNNQEFEPDYPDETDFWETKTSSGTQTSPVESIYLYEALGQLGKETAQDFYNEYATTTLGGLLHFCAEYGISLPKISGDFSGYPSVESIVLYEALRQLEPETAKFFCEEYGGTMTLNALCHFCATYGITMPYATTREHSGDLKSSENLAENSVVENIEKAPCVGLLEDENRSGRIKSRFSNPLCI